MIVFFSNWNYLFRVPGIDANTGVVLSNEAFRARGAESKDQLLLIKW